MGISWIYTIILKQLWFFLALFLPSELLLKKGYKETDPGMKTIGYRQLIEYLKGNMNANYWSYEKISEKAYTVMIYFNI